MGMNDRKQEERESKRLARRQKSLIVNVTVGMEDIDLQGLAFCLQAILNAGGALRIGRTRDGGAWAFGIYGDGPQPYTEYVRPSEDVNLYLANLRQFFEATIGPQVPHKDE